MAEVVTEWTSAFWMHMRMGGGKHGYSYKILANDEPTNIVLTKHTQRGRVTSKILSTGEDSYDMLAPEHSKERMEAWLEAHR